MKANKRGKLQGAGSKVESAPAFLDLSEEAADFVELKLPPIECLQAELESWEAASDEDWLELEHGILDGE